MDWYNNGQIQNKTSLKYACNYLSEPYAKLIKHWIISKIFLTS